jgi:hypothetical protein
VPLALVDPYCANVIMTRSEKLADVIAGMALDNPFLARALLGLNKAAGGAAVLGAIADLGLPILAHHAGPGFGHEQAQGLAGILSGVPGMNVDPSIPVVGASELEQAHDLLRAIARGEIGNPDGAEAAASPNGDAPATAAVDAAGAPTPAPA